MFDKLLFDRNAFDRSVSLNEISLVFNGTGSLRTQIQIRTPILLQAMRGSSQVGILTNAQQNVGLHIQGTGDFSDSAIVLRLALRNNNYFGQGSFKPSPSIQVPIRGAITGSGNMSVDDRVYFRQYLQMSTHGNGDMIPNITMKSVLHPFVMHSHGNLTGMIAVRLPLGIDLKGTSELRLIRLGAATENVIELLGLNLLPGETITIDTDLLQILIGSVEDVSSVTTDSVFFELNPGENEITIVTDSNEELNVTAIWQNRWL